MDSVSIELVENLKSIVFDCNWQLIGHVSQFSPLKCYKLYSQEELSDDVLLIRDNNSKFYAIDAKCSHEGGPLDQGDIEDIGDSLYIVCPWHHFDFNLTTGISSVGLQQQVYKTRIENEVLYINTPVELSLKRPFDSCTNNLSVDQNEQVQVEESIETLSYWATKILNTPDPNEKADLTHHVAEMWKDGKLNNFGSILPPDQPKRLETLNIIDPAKIRRGKGGTLASRVALLHSLANIEQWAIDLSWDIIARFGSTEFSDKTKLPKEFFDDFIKIATDEAKHFKLLDKRLVEMNSHFGALPVHNGLWQSAFDTKDLLLSRLAIIHMVHEARGLDVHPQTRQRFANQNDDESVKLLDILYQDEITHVAAGIRWFQFVCNIEKLEYISTFQQMVKQYFKSYLKPPFDTEGRSTAGMTEQWYLPLIKPIENQK